MRIAFSKEYVFDVPKGHKFPMEKYDLIPRQLLYEGIVEPNCFFVPGEIELEHVLRVHDPEYVRRFYNLELSPREQRLTGFQHNANLTARERMIAEGTRMGVHFAMEDGIAFNIAGGTHHAFSNRGEGFCMLNDQAIAAAYFLHLFPEKRVLILDLDVHQGNGTAEIFQKEERVFTFSMHGKDNYPLKKEQSDWDIELPLHCTDSMYLDLLATSLEKIDQFFRPDFLFYQSGTDVLATDKLGKLSLTHEGVLERDKMVLNYANTNDIPMVACMGGGYSPQIKHIVDAHVGLFREAAQLYDSRIIR